MKKPIPTYVWAIIGVSIFGAILIGYALNDRTTAHSTAGSIECSNAHGLLRNLQTMTDWDEVDEESVIVRILPEYWNLMASDDAKQRELVEAIANTDACVAGRARYISVYSPGEVIVGVSDPDLGIRTE